MLLKRGMGNDNEEWGMGNGKWEMQGNGEIIQKLGKTRNSYTLQINENMKAGYNVFEAKIIQSVFWKRKVHSFIKRYVLKPFRI